jgi:feruloyl esterase
MLALLGTLLLVTTPAAAGPSDTCEALAGKLDTATFDEVGSAVVAAKGDMPAYCRVQGTIKPSVGFEMRLPLAAWNGKFYQAGCGGYCGTLTTETPGYANGIVESVKRGYASIRTDGGHLAESPADGAWALGNRAALELYAHGWIPLAHAAGVEITRAFYGSDPKYSYMVGCSNGGRVGLVAAQRYPTLFDGIIVGCPAVDLTQAGGTFGAWLLNKNRMAGAPVLTRDFVRKLPFLIAALNAQCDGRDGQVDGLIARPSACRINYARIPTCAAGASGGTSPDNCLTAEEKEVVRLWHQGPRDRAGRQLFGGMPVGSEDFWKVWYLPPPSEAAGTQMADGFTRYIVSDPTRPGFSASSFDFDRDPARLKRDFAFLDANDTDLAAFREAGGKIIMWHGLADSLVVPSQTADYYDRMVKRMGSRKKVQQFFRYFEAPGLGHCWELPSASAPEEFDPLAAIEAWVERGVTPEEIVARPSARQGDRLHVTEVRYRPYPLRPIVGRP